MNVLAIGAHPDDIELGCAGALAAYAAAGHRVSLLVMTRGDCGGDPSVREAEQRASLEVLGGEKLFFGEARDTELTCSRDSISFIEKVVREVEPSIAFVNFPGDTHQDHRNLAQAFVPASRSLVQDVLFYESVSSQGFQPTVFMDITETLDTKLASINAHASQVWKTYEKDVSLLDHARTAAAYWGRHARVSAAEAFVPARLFLRPAGPSE